MHHRAVREGRDLAVLGESDVEVACVFEGPSHQLRILHSRAVVGEQSNTGVAQFAEGREVLPCASDGDAPRRHHLAESSPTALFPNEVDHDARVVRRFGVGHGHHGGEPTECCGPRAGLDGLGLLATGFAQVNVQVDQPGGDDASGGVENRAGVGQRRTRLDHMGDHTVLDAQVDRLAPIVGRRAVDDATTANRHTGDGHDGTPSPGAANRSNSTAIRTEIPLAT